MPENPLNTCRICGSAAQHRTFEVKEMLLGSRQIFAYFQCGACQTLQIAEFPSKMEAFYPTNYNSFGRPNRLASWAKGRRLSWTLFRDSQIGRWITALKGPAPMSYFLQELIPFREGAILDVGCGSGTLLSEMRAARFSNLTGIDPNLPIKSVSEEGWRLQKMSLLEMTSQFDVIMFNHSLEHVPDIAQMLRQAANLLTPGGRITVRMPVLGHAWETYGVHWIQLDAPRHFHLLSSSGFQKFAQGFGLDVVKTIFDSSDLQFWGSEQYKMDIAMNDARSYSVNPKRSPFSAGQISSFQQHALALNQKEAGDSAFFLLKKASHAV